MAIVWMMEQTVCVGDEEPVIASRGDQRLFGT